MSYAKQMRAFENDYQKQQTDSLNPQMAESSRIGMDEKSARKEIWDKTTRAMEDIRSKESLEFRNNILPEAIALRDDLNRRLGSAAPKPDSRAMIIFQGSLAGPSAISDGADYLEQLARSLP
jgi:hypothetical protein